MAAEEAQSLGPAAGMGMGLVSGCNWSVIFPHDRPQDHAHTNCRS